MSLAEALRIYGTPHIGHHFHRAFRIEEIEEHPDRDRIFATIRWAVERGEQVWEDT